MSTLLAFSLFACSIFSSTLKTQAVGSSEISINFYQTRQCHIPEDSSLHSHHPRNVKYHTIIWICCNVQFFHSFINGSSIALCWALASASVRNLFYTDCRPPCTSDQPVARLPPTHTTTQTQNKRTNRYPCLEWDSKPRSQRPSERRQFMP
jgi:hypothetical protein